MGCNNSKYNCNECKLEIGDYNTNYICSLKGLGQLNNERMCISCLFKKFKVQNYHSLNSELID